MVCKLSKEINSPERVEVPPSFKPPKSSGGKSAFRKSGETVRELVICGECLKPRCVYATKKRKLWSSKSTRRNSFMSVDHL